MEVGIYKLVGTLEGLALFEIADIYLCPDIGLLMWLFVSVVWDILWLEAYPSIVWSWLHIALLWCSYVPDEFSCDDGFKEWLWMI